jgi:hypothetical protein
VHFGLTVKRVERLKQKGRYADGGGLYLQINESGSKSWVFKFERTVRDGNGQPKRKETMMGLGGLATFGLAEAREPATLAERRARHRGSLHSRRRGHALMTHQPSGQASMLTEFLIRRSQVQILLLHKRRELVEVL